jgi:hypothetical protein
MQVIESKQDAIEYLQAGKKAGDILQRLEQLSQLLGDTDAEEGEEEENDDDE